MRRTKLIVLSLLTGFAIGIPALAQQATVSTYAACPDPPPALGPGEEQAAHGAFFAGKGAYDEGDYTKAIDYFKDAYRRDCSKPELLNYIARAYEAKGDKAEAIRALETYLQRKKDAPDAESVKRRIEKLKEQLAAQPTTTATPLTTSTATATATATSSTPPSGGHTVGPWIVVGGGAVATIAGVILVLVGNGKVQDSRAGCTNVNGTYTNCPPTPPESERTSMNSSGKTLMGVGFAVGGIGLAAVIGGLIWHFLEPTGETKTAIIPVFSPGYTGVSFEHRF